MFQLISDAVIMTKTHRSASPVLTCIGSLRVTHAQSVKHGWLLSQVH